MASLLQWSAFLITVLVRYGSTGELMKLFSLKLNNAVTISFMFCTFDIEMSIIIFNMKKSKLK